MKTKPSKQRKKPKRTVQLKDLKPKKDADGGYKMLTAPLILGLDQRTGS
jgi:hypothetical protein